MSNVMLLNEKETVPVLAFEFHPLVGEHQFAMDNSHPLTDIYIIGGTSNSIESDLPASQLISILGDDHKPDSTDGIILSSNVIWMFQKLFAKLTKIKLFQLQSKGDSPVKKDTEYWQSIANYFSQGTCILYIIL